MPEKPATGAQRVLVFFQLILDNVWKQQKKFKKGQTLGRPRSLLVVRSVATWNVSWNKQKSLVKRLQIVFFWGIAVCRWESESVGTSLELPLQYFWKNRNCDTSEIHGQPTLPRVPALHRSPVVV